MIHRTLSQAVGRILEQNDRQVVERLARLPFEKARTLQRATDPLDVMTYYFEVLDGALRDGRLDDSAYDAVLARITEIAAAASPHQTAPRPTEPEPPQV